MNEKRAIPRNELMLYLEVWNHDKTEKIGHLIDVSILGLLLMSPVPMDTDKRIRLEVKLPGTHADPGWAGMEAEILRCKPSSKKGYWDVALRITDISFEEQIALEDVIFAYRFKS